MRDLVVSIALVIALASLITVHVAIVWGLAFRPPRWRAPAAFFVMPLGVYWAWREKMRARIGIFVGALVIYIAANVIGKL